MVAPTLKQSLSARLLPVDNSVPNHFLRQILTWVAPTAATPLTYVPQSLDVRIPSSCFPISGCNPPNAVKRPIFIALHTHIELLIAPRWSVSLMGKVSGIADQLSHFYVRVSFPHPLPSFPPLNAWHHLLLCFLLLVKCRIFLPSRHVS